MRRNKTKKKRFEKTVDSFHAFRRTLSSKRKRVRYIRTRSTCEPIDRGLSSLSRFVARWRNAMMRTTGGDSLRSPSPSLRPPLPPPAAIHPSPPSRNKFLRENIAFVFCPSLFRLQLYTHTLARRPYTQGSSRYTSMHVNTYSWEGSVKTF